MAKVATKQVPCITCGNSIEVPKWSANKQECEACKGTQSQEDVGIEQLSDDIVEEEPVAKLKHAQEVLEALGFNITPNGWRKQYQDGNAVVRIEPFFDHGTSMDQAHALEGFTIIRQEFVAVVDREMGQKLPLVAHQDINTLLQELDIKLPGVNLQATNIDTIKCSKCGRDTGEWIQLVNSKEMLCLEKCAPVKHPRRI
jgi:NAD-dependent SIR2 family protein deacetylase